MKKIFVFLALAFLFGSCVVNVAEESRRSSRNLSYFCQDLCDVTVLYIVSTIDTLSEKEPILQEGYSKNNVACNGYKLSITKVQDIDSTWTVNLTDENNTIQNFVGTVKMLPDGPHLFHEWQCNCSGKYIESTTDYSADFSTEGNIKLSWEKEYYSAHYGTRFSLVRDGTFKTVTYDKGKQLDWCTLYYVKDDITCQSNLGSARY